ncbi:hypothetical protein GBAR_LOCUS4074 [Geodia barretti]|uniref:C3H1-type domain-containing protein n=1 Tax=Geodia barretti TaxID=519541 RepID=A0AA35R5W4_GEOBA|nr:hypothetical protein GBAR_LOCUS4074 [Geodia barretti]
MSCVGAGVEEGDLDYNEDLDDITSHLRRPSEEDEVKVHAAVEIEDGELSSGEEGEIKDVSGEMSGPAHLQNPSTPSPTPEISDDIIECEPQDYGVGEEKREENGKKEREEEKSKEDEKEEADSDRGSSSRRKVTGSRSPVRNRGTSVCRHFLQGKCSWGRECRFSHDDRALPGHPRPHPPLHGVRGGADRFIEPYHAPRDPDFVGHPPIGSVLTHHLPPPQPPREGAPLFLPYKELRRGSKVSQVEEESEGWYRLRTVARDWSSDDDDTLPEKKSSKEKRQKGDDRRNRHSSRREVGLSIVWCQVSDIVLRALAPRVLRQQRRKRREGTNTRQPQAYLAIWTKQLTLGIYTLCLKVELQNMSTARILLYKNLHLTRRPSTVYTVCMCTWSVWCRDKESGFEDRASRRKARRHSSSSESSETQPAFLPHQPPFLFAPGTGPPPDRFFAHSTPFPPFGPPRPLPPHLDHRPLLFAPIPPHVHYPDRYGPPPYPDCHRQPPHRGYHRYILH